ncbi:tripartite tricarboxylate transporter substrate binding protein [Verticiella sediminum]|uniref:Tripartite tricarboxylate transporter substrate binding protein n=1 Tax=Verticiella sediminum TaxID=1247510 RepID=A0A556AWN5_9BURK|nr:tripartite tricarboxylate transporter substrate binding protein [Verticiella sediminum]TSH97358.1 tripartite tricarboxylate transporter substrate binding protein [Verticiella sediminum]
MGPYQQHKRRWRRFAAALGLSALLGAAAHAEYPERPVTIVVPYAAGGGTDAVARTLAASLQSTWGEPVIVENRAGVDGWIGTQRVLSQPADGYTVLLQLNSMLLWPWAVPEAKVDIARDLTLITKLQSSPMVPLVRGDSAAGTLEEMFQHCKARATGCSYGYATPSAELVGRQLAELGGLENAVTVPYKGTSQMVNDLLGGHIDIALVSAALATPLHHDKRAKALAVGTPERYTRLPDVPTFDEAGYPAKGGTTWYGLMVREGTPQPIVDRIYRAVQDAGKKPDVLTAIESQGGIPVFNTPDEFRRDVAEDLEAITPLGKKYLAR